ncbi:MAG: hypothetical protein WCI42_03335 [Verrucomicrobiota bacterium]
MASETLLPALRAVLAQGSSLIESLDDHVYTAKPTIAGGASIGAHYRHCLDHFGALLTGDASGGIDYDARKRDPRIENEREAALEMTHHLRDLASSFDSSILRSPVSVRCGVSYTENRSPVVHSSFEREVMFSISHAVHHYALIAMICRSLSATIPEGFGVAPSTVHYRRESTLFRS